MKNSLFWPLLVNPFTRIGGWRAFFIGLVIILLTTVVGYLGSTTPIGLLSIRPMDDVSIGTVFMCQLSVLAVLVVVVYITALITTRHVRFQDALGITALAQAPTLLLIAVGPIVKPIADAAVEFVKNGSSDALNQLQHTGSYLFIMVIGLVLAAVLAWYVVVLYNGFKTLTDLKGAKSIIIFIVLIILCDVLSSYLISLLTNGTINRFTLS